MSEWGEVTRHNPGGQNYPDAANEIDRLRAEVARLRAELAEYQTKPCNIKLFIPDFKYTQGT